MAFVAFKFACCCWRFSWRFAWFCACTKLLLCALLLLAPAPPDFGPRLTLTRLILALTLLGISPFISGLAPKSSIVAAEDVFRLEGGDVVSDGAEDVFAVDDDVLARDVDLTFEADADFEVALEADWLVFFAFFCVVDVSTDFLASALA